MKPKSKSDPTKTRKRRIEYLVVGSTIQTLPMPPRLPPHLVKTEARELTEESFEHPIGVSQIRELRRQGWRLLSWPDGTRFAYRLKGGKNLTAQEGAYLYGLSRTEIEARLGWAESARGAPN